MLFPHFQKNKNHRPVIQRQDSKDNDLEIFDVKKMMSVF